VAHLSIGERARPEQIRAWDIDVRADGAGLPAGSGSVLQGQALYQQHCLACHGDKGVGGTAPRLVGGRGTLTGKAPVLTVGSYWPYATTLYDYINRAMPLDKPQSLKPDEVYALSAYILNQNGIIKADAVLDATSLPKVEMPNRNGFRPDWN
jgi:cytochrome c